MTNRWDAFAEHELAELRRGLLVAGLRSPLLSELGAELDRRVDLRIAAEIEDET